MSQTPWNILIAEDDENLGTLLAEYLQSKGYQTTLSRDGKDALALFGKNIYDFCLLDVMMPLMDGFELAKKIRAVNQQVPILFLTAKGMKEDKLKGFDAGADDYLTKPFSMEELLARMQAIIKRTGKNKAKEQEKSEYALGKYIFFPGLQKLQLSDQEIKLTFKESELLKIMCQHQNELIERSFALKKIWGDDSYYNSRSMDVYLTKLRKYLKEEPSIEIVSVHGKGFKMML